MKLEHVSTGNNAACLSKESALEGGTDAVFDALLAESLRILKQSSVWMKEDEKLVVPGCFCIIRAAECPRFLEYSRTSTHPHPSARTARSSFQLWEGLELHRFVHAPELGGTTPAWGCRSTCRTLHGTSKTSWSTCTSVHVLVPISDLPTRSSKWDVLDYR